MVQNRAWEAQGGETARNRWQEVELQGGGRLRLFLPEPAAAHDVCPATPPLPSSEAERLAALGQLTAGVAHEIKNPLNFINNFADLSGDLVEEIRELFAPALDRVESEARTEIEELLSLVQQNCIKINRHGRRAEAIIKTMLLHARRGVDNTQSASLNGLIEEAITLVGEDLAPAAPEPAVTITPCLDPEVGNIECFPEDLLRALLNFITNGVYAARQHDGPAPPAVTITTRSMGDRVQVTIRDNGIGMKQDVLDQAMTPFFTTKPPGEGTGLGLSLSHDVICRQHRGQMNMTSEPRSFTEVELTLFRALPERRRGDRRRGDD